MSDCCDHKKILLDIAMDENTKYFVARGCRNCGNVNQIYGSRYDTIDDLRSVISRKVKNKFFNKLF